MSICRVFKSNLNMVGLSKQFNSTMFWFTIWSPRYKKINKRSIHSLFALLILFSFLILRFLSNLVSILSPRLELPFYWIIILYIRLFNFPEPAVKRKISKTSNPFYGFNRYASKVPAILWCTFIPIIS